MLAMDEPFHAQGRWGMALFMSRGYSVWMHAWTQATPDMCPRPVSEAGEVVSLPDQVHTEMVSALAGMVLDALRKEAA